MNGEPLNLPLVSYLLHGSGRDGAVREALMLADESPGRFSTDVAEFLATHLMAQAEDGPREVLRRLDGFDNPTARFVRARVLGQCGESEAAIDLLRRTLDSLPAPDAQVLLHRARLLAQRKRFPEAAADLVSALRLFPPYSFFVKSQKLLERIIASGGWQPRRKARLAILGTSTTALLTPVIRACGFRAGLQLEVYEGVYGNYQQEVLNPDSGLYRFQPDLVMILLNHRDLALPPAGGDTDVPQAVANLRELWTTLRRRNPCHLVQVGFDIPSGGAWGSLEYTLSAGRRRAIAQINLALTEDLPAGVSFLDVNEVAAQYGPQFRSEVEWCSSKQYPSLNALPLFADHVCSHFLAALGLTSKVLALDLDNTLWGGVIAEDLLGGIRVGPPTAEGEGYLELQKYVKELQQRGVVLAACSKNNLTDAERPFREHDAIHLRLEDFAAFVANWQDKATNLEAIAAELSLGLESFVFLDDNPLERAIVRSRLPQVVVPECGQSPWEMLAALRRGRYFETFALTQEDLDRNAGYRRTMARKSLERAATSLHDFLQRLEMVGEHGPVDEDTIPRVAQLINKTNQFNLTTRRYTEAQVRLLSQSPDWWCHWFRLADRFGDHGLVGVILAQVAPPRWTIDSWLMSCRVLGRTLEDFMFSVLLSAAREWGAFELVGEYVPTEKNQLVRDLYRRFGFAEVTEHPDRYVFDVANSPVHSCEFIRLKSREQHGRLRVAA